MRALPVSITQLVLLLLLPVLVVFGDSAARKAMEIHELRARAEHLRREIEQLQVRHQELLRQRDYLASDQYLEKVAREELGLIKPTERAVIVVVRGDAPSESPALPLPPTDQRSNPQRWWDFFFASRP
ncbi:MAG: septum formation initiator family protein [Chloroflexi bacterium]|nr:septum formation initiator family protein [Chloroflexota bacterium]